MGFSNLDTLKTYSSALWWACSGTLANTRYTRWLFLERWSSSCAHACVWSHLAQSLLNQRLARPLWTMWLVLTNGIWRESVLRHFRAMRLRSEYSFFMLSFPPTSWMQTIRGLRGILGCIGCPLAPPRTSHPPTKFLYWGPNPQDFRNRSYLETGPLLM